MPKRIPSAEGAVLRTFRQRRGATQEELGRKSGYSPRTLERMETGFYSLDRERLVEILSHLDVPPEAVEAALLADELAHAPKGEDDRLIERAAAAGGWAGVRTARAGLKAELLRRKAPRHRRWAEERWSRIKKLKACEQARAVEALLGDDRSWSLAERLCLASNEAAANRADEALRLAQLAMKLAEQVPDEDFRLHLLGWVEPFLANALRVGGDLASSARSLAHADELWAASASFGLLDEARRLDLKASLLMHYGRFEEVNSILAEALRRAQSDRARARILIMHARNLELAGEYEAAIEALEKVRPLIDTKNDPRLLFAHDFNKAVSLTHLGKYAEVEPLLLLIEAMTDDGNELDRVRLRWLQGRVWAGLGRRNEGIAALREVREYFHNERIAYDFAVVSTELGSLYLELGFNRSVQQLAEEMLWIIESQGVHKQALEALVLFCRAARIEKAQADWTRRLVKYLYRAQNNPNLKFEAR